MTNTRAIDIDFDVHHKIELARTSFEETPNHVLRRLLGIAPNNAANVTASPTVEPDGRSWSGKGVTLPHGTELKMEYNGKVYTGRIEQGDWLVEGTRVKSPSDAACSVATTKDGTRPSLNGWMYWRVKRPGERTWRLINEMRR